MALFKSKQRDLPEMLRDAFYEQFDPRRRQEISDARMIQEDRFDVANLSRRPIHKQFNPNRFNQSPWEDDEIGEF